MKRNKMSSVNSMSKIESYKFNIMISYDYMYNNIRILDNK